jgi:hypothetical protein
MGRRDSVSALKALAEGDQRRTDVPLRCRCAVSARNCRRGLGGDPLLTSVPKLLLAG